MKYNDVLHLMPKTPVFSTQQLFQLDEWFHRENLFHWQKSWKIVQLKRWRYAFMDRIWSESDIMIVAHQLVQPSYVSMESALSIHNLIPEWVMHTTSITTKKTQQVDTKIGMFMYRSISAHHFWWYELVTTDVWSYYLAHPEKAILDYLYYHHTLHTVEDMQEWRILSGELYDTVDQQLFLQYLEKFDHKALQERATLFLDTINHA